MKNILNSANLTNREILEIHMYDTIKELNKTYRRHPHNKRPEHKPITDISNSLNKLFELTYITKY